MDYYGRNLCRFLKGLGVISGDQKEIFLSRGKTTGTALDLVSDKKVDVTPFSFANRCCHIKIPQGRWSSLSNNDS